jgi:hypothetical protein
MGAYPTIAGAAAAAGGAFEDRSLENVKSNYLAGRDETLAGLKQAQQSPSYIVGDTAGSIAPMAIPAAGAVSKMGLGAKVGLGAVTGGTTAALRTEQDQEAGQFEDLAQTGLKTAIGGTIGAAGAGVAHGLGKGVEASRRAGGTLKALDNLRSDAADFIDETPSFKSLIAKMIRGEDPPAVNFPQNLTDEQIQLAYPTSKRAQSFAQSEEIGESLQPTQPPSFKELEAYQSKLARQTPAEARVKPAPKGQYSPPETASRTDVGYTPKPRQGSFEQPEPIYPMKLEELKAQEAARKGALNVDESYMSSSGGRYQPNPRQGSVNQPEGIYMTPTYKEGVKDLESQMKSQYKQQLDSQKLSQQKSIIDQKAAAKAQADELAQLEYYQPTQKPTFKELDQFQTQQSKQIPQDILPQKPMTYKELEAYSRQQQAQSMRDLQLEDLQTRKSLTGENEDLMQQIMAQRQAEVPEIPQSIRDFEIPQPMQNLEELQQVVSKAPQIQMTPRPQPSISTPSWRPIEGMPFQTPMPAPAGVKSFPEYPEQEWVPQGTYKSLEQRLKEFQARRR